VAPLPSYSQDRGDSEAYDPLSRVGTHVDLRESLRMQSRLVVASEDYRVADYLVENINEKGLLEVETDEVATILGITLESVERVLAILQTLDPPGVAARSVQESLLIQLAQMKDEREINPLAETIIRNHWRDLANHAFQKIARTLDCSEEAVNESIEFIRNQLSPFPGLRFSSDWQQPSISVIQRPDVIIRKRGAQYQVEVTEPFDFELRLSDSYLRLRTLLAKRNLATEERIALDQLNRAIWLIRAVQMRLQTLKEVAECVVKLQATFLESGSKERMRPITRVQVARLVGKHGSTVGRAISHKYVLLPNNSLMPFGQLLRDCPRTEGRDR